MVYIVSWTRIGDDLLHAFIHNIGVFSSEENALAAIDWIKSLYGDHGRYDTSDDSFQIIPCKLDTANFSSHIIEITSQNK